MENILFIKFNFTNATELMPTKFEHLNFTNKMEKPKELFFCFLFFIFLLLTPLLVFAHTVEDKLDRLDRTIVGSAKSLTLVKAVLNHCTWKRSPNIKSVWEMRNFLHQANELHRLPTGVSKGAACFLLLWVVGNGATWGKLEPKTKIKKKKKKHKQTNKQKNSKNF